MSKNVLQQLKAGFGFVFFCTAVSLNWQLSLSFFICLFNLYSSYSTEWNPSSSFISIGPEVGFTKFIAFYLCMSISRTHFSHWQSILRIGFRLHSYLTNLPCGHWVSGFIGDTNSAQFTTWAPQNSCNPSASMISRGKDDLLGKRP